MKIIPEILSFSFYWIIVKEKKDLGIESSFIKDKGKKSMV